MPFLRKKSSLLGRRHSVTTDKKNTGNPKFSSVPDDKEDYPGGNPSTAAVEDPAHRSSYGIPEKNSDHRSTSLTVAMMEDPFSFSNSFTTKHPISRSISVPEEGSSSSPAAATTATLPNPRWEQATSSSSVSVSSASSSSSSSIRLPTTPRRRSCLKSPNTAFTSAGPSRRPVLQQPRSSIKVYVTGQKHKITRERHIGLHDDVDIVLIPSLLELALEHDAKLKCREMNDDDPNNKSTKEEKQKTTLFRRSSSFFQRQQHKRQIKQQNAIKAQQVREELWCSPQEYESMGMETETLICLAAGLGEDFRKSEQLHENDDAFTSQYCTRGLESHIAVVQKTLEDPSASTVVRCPKDKSRVLVHALRTTQREQHRRKTYNADALAHLCQTQTRRDIADAYQRARRNTIGIETL